MSSLVNMHQGIMPLQSCPCPTSSSNATTHAFQQAAPVIPGQGNFSPNTMVPTGTRQHSLNAAMDGISTSTFNLLTQINMMLVSVLSGLTQFLASLMQSAAQGNLGIENSNNRTSSLPGSGSIENNGNDSEVSETSETRRASSENSSGIEFIPADRNPDGSNVRATRTMNDYKERFGVTNLGIWGDEAHQKRKSDHNTGDAADLGVSSISQGNEVTNALINEAEARGVKYIIFNNKIWSVARRDEGWRTYSGSNPHTGHVHVSFNA